MATAFIEVDQSKAARIFQALRAIREGRAILGQELAAAAQKVNGSTAVAANFTVYATKYGFVANDYADANTAAKAGFDELNSLYLKLIKLSGDGDATGAALDQACAKFGV